MNLLSRRDFMFCDIVILVAKFTGLQPMKPRYKYSCVNPTNLMAQIYSPSPPEL
jgi:hypothetical protein